MAGTFVKETSPEPDPESGVVFHPVKIVLPPNKSRILYFKHKQDQKIWLDKLSKAVGYTNIFDFYEVDRNLGKGQFGLVKLATHKESGMQVAIKTVKKANMK